MDLNNKIRNYKRRSIMGNLNNDELLMMNTIDAEREHIHMVAKTSGILKK